MNKKIENEATVILLEMFGILGIGEIVKIMKKIDKDEERGYLIANYIFKNIRKVKTQLEDLIDLLIDEDVNIVKGMKLLQEDEEVVSFFTEFLDGVM